MSRVGVLITAVLDSQVCVSVNVRVCRKTAVRREL